MDNIYFTYFAELDPSQQSQGQPQPMLGLDILQFNTEDEMMNIDFDRAHFQDEGELSEVEMYEGAGTCYARDGVTFLDLFDADKYAEHRKENLFYPFASREEWEVADFLLCSPLSMAAINQFLGLPMLLCVYSEWLTSDSAWMIQDQLPRGATVLGTVLSSDKMNITNMTGARVTHPLLLGLANIHMSTCTKLSSRAFLLTALLPIPEYLYPKQRMWGMLEDHLMHECLSIVLKPLMIAAEIGIMMSDPVGNVRHCFTPLAAYIVDTLEAFVGVQELDFHISILQPTVGYHHFHGGISKLKQVMGRVHRDIQCYIIGLIAGAAPHRFVVAICALMDVWYMAQSPPPDENFLAHIDRSLSIFHENKEIILSLGAQMGMKKPINNWFIPKLKLMQSITASSRKVGALIQWSADTTEHAHISEIKDPAWHTNNNDYDPQICRHLDHQEKL
ncbi:hypothetical protein C8R48DRAFT_670848 [Suillus tomentosus]|nr:hypothetical protein C8R48DRAFT_670848 [Suillus tomentosus]